MRLTPLLVVLATSYTCIAEIVRSQRPLQDASSFTSSLLQLHKDLVQLRSISGSEGDVAQYLTLYLKSHDFVVEHQSVEPGLHGGPPRGNLYAYLGTPRKTRVIVSSHIDTVPPYYPYERRGDEIWGRGTVDDKACVAAQLTAVMSMVASGKLSPGDVGILFVVDEEVTGAGMRRANDLHLTPETVIFGEPTELKLASGHKGNLRASIRAKGKAGHSGYPWLGKNANALMVEALHALMRMEQHLPGSDKYGNTTMNLGQLTGGVAGNVIAEHAEAEVVWRIAKDTPEELKRRVTETLKAIDSDLSTEFSTGYPPVHIDSDVKGFDTIVVNYGTDIPNFQGDHKRYLYGPGDILVAHSDHEHLSIADLEESVHGYIALIEHALKSSTDDETTLN